MSMLSKVSLRLDEKVEAEIKREAARHPRMTPSDWIREQITLGLRKADKAKEKA